MGNRPTKGENDLSSTSDELSKSTTTGGLSDITAGMEALELSSTEITLQDLAMGASIASGPHGVVYRGLFFERHVAVKKFDKELLANKGRSKLEELRFDLALIGALPTHDNIVSFVGFVASPLSVVMELVEGGNLRDALFTQKTKPLDWKQRLKIALDVAAGLAFLHSHGVVHGNIKPENVLLTRRDDDSITAKLADGGIRSIVTCLSHPSFASPEEITQGGIVEKSSDVFSLGILLFEILAEKTAYFDVSNPNELLRRVASDPQFRPSLTDVLQRKDLHKTQRHFIDLMRSCWDSDTARRPTALELVSLLKDINAQLINPSYVSRFEMLHSGGVMSHRAVFTIPDKLFGRDIELQVLKDLFSSQQQNPSSVRCIVVNGVSGVGKTAFVRQAFTELTSALNPERFSFHSGKFDRDSSVPYSGVLQVFRSAIETRIFGPIHKNPKQSKTWKSVLEKALGKNAQIIVQAFPQLETVLGKDIKPAPALSSPEEVVARFLETFAALSRTLTGPHHHLVFFLDDIQWADSRSLALMQKLLMANQMITLVLSFRDNEVNDSQDHPVHKLISSIKKTSALRMHTMNLASPSVADLNRMCCEALRCLSPENVMPLTNTIYLKTHGNPFYFRQMLSLLHQHRLIEYDDEAGSWKWDIHHIRDLTLSIGGDLVEIMVNNLRKLPMHTQNILKLASCIGRVFKFDILSQACQEIALDDGARIGAITETDLNESVDRNYLAVTHTGASAIFQFAHDRILQAAHSLWSNWNVHAPRVQLSIGRLLKSLSSFASSASSTLHDGEAQLRDRSSSNTIFSIAMFMNSGRELLRTKQELLELTQINVDAALKAQEATDFVKALEFCRIGTEILRTRLAPLLASVGDSCIAVSGSLIWNDQESRPLACKLIPLAQKLEYWYGTEKQGDEHFEDIGAHSRSDNIRSVAFVTKALKLELSGLHSNGLELLKTFFSSDPDLSVKFGTELVRPEVIGPLFLKVRETLIRRNFQQISKSKVISQEEAPPMMNIICGMQTLASLSLKPVQSLFIVLRAIEIALDEVEIRLGESGDDGANANADVGARLCPKMLAVFMAFSFIASNVRGDFSLARQIAEAVMSHPLANAMPDIVVNYNIHAKQLTHPIKDIYHVIIEQSLPLAQSNGSRTYIAYHCPVLMCWAVVSGKTIHSLMRQFDEISKQMLKENLPMHLPAFQVTRLLRLLEDVQQNQCEFLETVEQLREMAIPYIPAALMIFEAVVLTAMLMGDQQAVISNTAISEPLKQRLKWKHIAETAENAIKRCVVTITPLFMNAQQILHACIAHCRLIGSGEPEQDHLPRIDECIAKLGVWAKEMPHNFGSLHKLALAEKARAVRQQPVPDVAIQYYRDALEAARTSEIVLTAAEAAEALGFYCREHNLPQDDVRKTLLEARDIYTQFGAKEKVRQLECDPLLVEVLKQQAAQPQQPAQQPQQQQQQQSLTQNGSTKVVCQDPLYEFAEWALAEAERDETLRKLIEKHFVSEFTVEVLHFYFKAKEFARAEPSVVARAPLLRQIYSGFIEAKAPLEINVSSEMRAHIAKVVAQLDVLSEMEQQLLLREDLLKDLVISVRSDMIESLGRFRASAEFQAFEKAMRRKRR